MFIVNFTCLPSSKRKAYVLNEDIHNPRSSADEINIVSFQSIK